jgi:iron-sulfur cluster repair protein YtfE (RIC family)
MLDREMTVNDTILKYPATLTVFKSLGIDSCCGGSLTLAEAARRHGHDPDLVRKTLEAVIEMTEPMTAMR